MAIYSIYYMKSEFFSEGVNGYDWLKEHNRIPNVADLTTSHVYLITIESDTLEDVYFKMQGESWCPKSEARELTASEGLRHTSMAVGDIAIDHSSRFAYMVDRKCFRFLGKVATIGET